ncbi:MAG TPA: DUF6335 family protein [Anaerolineales bacterium]|nr:DUF6335 family protein [Anaerolineales bacterium]
MATEKKEKTTEETDEIEKTIDPYTGEWKPVPEDADQFIEVIPEETDNREGSNYLLNEETSMDAYAANADSNAAAEQAAHYTDDEDIEADFAERQQLAASGRDVLLEELDEHNSLSPEITGGDVDASWQTANQAGEETVGGSVSTPDQDVVEEIGQGAGLVYKDDEPLNYDAKVLDRDRNRWELNPASALDEDEELSDEEDPDEEDEDELESLDELEEEENEDLEDDELDGDDLDDELEEDEDDLDDELEDEEDDEA